VREAKLVFSGYETYEEKTREMYRQRAYRCSLKRPGITYRYSSHPTMFLLKVHKHPVASLVVSARLIKV
jgi:hypothetical protein